jgi:hypothetical protein
VSTVTPAAGDIRNAVPVLFPDPLPGPPPDPPPFPLPDPPPSPPPAPCAAGLPVGVGVGLGGGALVLPEAAGLDGGGEADGDGEGTAEAVGVGVRLAVGVGAAECVDEVLAGRPVPDVDPVAGRREVVGVALPGDFPVVGAGECVTPGAGALPGSWVRSAATTLPTITSRTSARSAIRGSETERRRRRRPPVPAPPGIGSSAVADRWKRSGPSGGVPPGGNGPPASRAPLAAALPGAGSAPLGATGAPG